MELEQRIRSLELEMRILKNEVQRTLLDVQDQVLRNPRAPIGIEPNLIIAKVQAIEPARAQQPTPRVAPAAKVTPAAAPAVPVVTGAPAPKPPAASAAPTAPVTEPALKAPMSLPAAPPPMLKKVSLEEIRAAQSELDAGSMAANSAAVEKLVELVQKPEAAAADTSTGDAAALAERGGIKLLEWLMSSASKVNGERDEKAGDRSAGKTDQTQFACRPRSDHGRSTTTDRGDQTWIRSSSPRSS